MKQWFVDLLLSWLGPSGIELSLSRNLHKSWTREQALREQNEELRREIGILRRAMKGLWPE